MRAVLLGILAISAPVGQARSSYYVDGDPIGVNSSTTDNTGGFTAVQKSGANIGQPAILVALDGSEVLTEFRTVVFGVANPEGDLHFDEFDYRLEVWRVADYFAGSEPAFHLDLGKPSGINLVSNEPNITIPDTPFGTAGVGGGNAATYDFHFDLTNLPVASLPQGVTCAFDSPLAAGGWVFGFQSWHDPSTNGILRVSGASADEGPLPLFSRDDSVPRGILGGQDPDNIILYWGMSLAVAADNNVSNLKGDFNSDRVVDAADYTTWRDNLGAANESALNYNGDDAGGVDGGDYNLWQQNFGLSLNPDTHPNFLRGDFNADGKVDAADYTVWRDNLGALNELSINNNGDGADGVDLGDYELWQENFGLCLCSTIQLGNLDGDTNGIGAETALSNSDLSGDGTTMNALLQNAQGGLYGDFAAGYLSFEANSATSQDVGAGLPEPSTAFLVVASISGLVFRRTASNRRSSQQPVRLRSRRSNVRYLDRCSNTFNNQQVAGEFCP